MRHPCLLAATLPIDARRRDAMFLRRLMTAAERRFAGDVFFACHTVYCRRRRAAIYAPPLLRDAPLRFRRAMRYRRAACRHYLRLPRQDCRCRHFRYDARCARHCCYAWRRRCADAASYAADAAAAAATPLTLRRRFYAVYAAAARASRGAALPPCCVSRSPMPIYAASRAPRR